MVGHLAVPIARERPVEKLSVVETGDRPIHLSAMDPESELPDYLLQLCGPEVSKNHGGEIPEWYRDAARTLADQGLSWPKPRIGLDDPLLLANVREHEAQAAPLLATDPAAAVTMLERLIRYEEEKFQARSWRGELARSAAGHHGRPEPAVFREMLEDLPERYFEMMIEETLGNHPDDALAEIAVAQSLRRGPRPQWTGLAAIIRNRALAFQAREHAARALSRGLDLSFDPNDVDGRDWTFEVGERLREDPAAQAQD